MQKNIQIKIYGYGRVVGVPSPYPPPPTMLPPSVARHGRGQ